MLATENLREADRVMTICNACRYCEGLCAVFPAMEMRRTFAAGDLNYLANLCHQCGACYPDCQYAPPHEFNVNIPATMAKLRNEGYAAYAWPGALSGLFQRNGVYVTLATALSVAAFIAGFVAWSDPAALFSPVAGDFYRLMPHNAMAGLLGIVALYCILAFVMSLTAFWRDIGGPQSAPGVAGFVRALGDTFHLTYLHGGGGGCTSEGGDAPSPSRRMFHHSTFYGFLFCFAATSVATLYHYAFGWHAPLCADQRSSRARHDRRHRPGRRSDRPHDASGRTRPDTKRHCASRHERRLHPDAVSHRRNRPAAARAPRHRRHGHAARHPSRRRHGPVPEPA